MTLLDL